MEVIRINRRVNGGMDEHEMFGLFDPMTQLIFVASIVRTQ